MRFHFGVSLKGTTGWMLSTNRRSSLGPTPFSQLSWKGTLARSATGFESAPAIGPRDAAERPLKEGGGGRMLRGGW
jgi:hypothetical protein